MRIIAGSLRHREIQTPPGKNTRPILDRVKQALFDALGSWYGTPSELPRLRVLDVFCGGGTLGLEAISRGAAHCTFIEQDKSALACLHQNVRSLAVTPEATIFADSVAAFSPPLKSKPFELIFLDPPYPMTNLMISGDTLHRFMTRLGNDIPVADDALCLWRFDPSYPPSDIPIAGWKVAQSRRYGRSEIRWMVPEHAA